MARSTYSETAKDTIIARATPNGDGAIAVIRISGSDAISISNQVFKSREKSLGNATPRTAMLGTFFDPTTDHEIDQGLCLVWKNPNSFTGEDLCEFHLHGSSVIVSQVIQACLAQGARLARAGEFSQRAYHNGKIDLAQAEAICDLVSSRTEDAGRAALHQLRGGLSEKLTAIRDALVPVVAELEAHVDFPEEGIEGRTRNRLGKVVDQQRKLLDDWLSTSKRGQYLRSGVRIALAGPPNAGKSSLFNALLKRERALVTPHAGTTRDTLEAEIDLMGLPMTLVDTAGLRQTQEEIEAMGIDRARQEFKQCDLLLFLVDAQQPKDAIDEYGSVKDFPHLVIINKSDLISEEFEDRDSLKSSKRLGLIRLSATTQEGMEKLESELVAHFGGRSQDQQDAMITNSRHINAITRSIEHLETASEAVSSGISPEFILVDLTEAIGALDSITGRQTLDEDVLDQIFSTFCLGK